MIGYCPTCSSCQYLTAANGHLVYSSFHLLTHGHYKLSPICIYRILTGQHNSYQRHHCDICRVLQAITLTVCTGLTVRTAQAAPYISLRNRCSSILWKTLFFQVGICHVLNEAVFCPSFPPFFQLSETTELAIAS